MRKLLIAAVAALPLLASGCVASTVLSVATAPVRVAGKAVAMVAPNQREADRKAGRKLRKEREREARDSRKQQQQQRDADDGRE